MILKIDYYDSEGVFSYKYYEGFHGLVISSYETNKNVYKDGKVKCDGTEINPDYWGFAPSSIENELYINCIWFYENKTGVHVTIVAVAGTVFLMNENGKTIDKY